jgi:glycosyltransferase involved in cell wall biosynthesis
MSPTRASGRRWRVLVLAEAANPKWISVPMVGWKHVEAIADIADVHLVTHVRNRENILANGWPMDRSTFIGPTPVERYVEKIEDFLGGRNAMGGVTQTALGVPRYYQFEDEAWEVHGAQLRRGEYDIVHRVTPVSPGVPSTIAEKVAETGVPFVLGPVNGGVPWPRGYEEERRREGEWIGRFRRAYRLLPGYGSVRKHSTAILVGSAAAWREMPRGYDDKLFYLPENAIDPARFSKQTAAYEQRPLRAAFVGRLVACKGTSMLVSAAAPLVREGKLVLDIIGDGPEREPLIEQVKSLGVTQGIRLDGWVPHDQLQDRLRQSAVFTFPSIREFGGGALMEAMMLGLVPVVVDYGGPSEIVEDACGFRVPLLERQEVVRRLGDVLQRLVAMPTGELRELGQRARQHILDNYSLAAKKEKTRAIYAWIKGDTKTRPAMRPPERSLALY